MLPAPQTSVHHRAARAPDAGMALPELRDLASGVAEGLRMPAA